jgi:hypothetical protein
MCLPDVRGIAQAQWGEEEMSEKPSFRERIFTGGGFGLSFSSYYDYVSVSPLIVIASHRNLPEVYKLNIDTQNTRNTRLSFPPMIMVFLRF